MRCLVAMMLGVLVWGATSPASAQITGEIHGSFGITSVDVGAWAGVDPADSDQANGGAHAQLFFGDATGRETVLGVEVGYEYLFYYEVTEGTELRDEGVDSFRAMLVGRLPVGGGDLFLEGAAGGYIGSGFTSPAVGVGFGMAIPVGPGVQIPLRLRGDAIFNSDAIAVPVMASGGLSIAFGRGGS